MTDDGEGGRPGFDVTRRGYRTSQVDAWVDRTTEQLDALRKDLDDARQLARSLQTSLDEARARSATETFGARAEKVLRLAEHDARLRREKAEREAEEIRELVHFEAERTIAEARSDAARVRESAERDAGRARKAATQEADHIRDEAEQEAAGVRAEAEQVATRTRAAADGAVRAARAEVAAARRDADLRADTAASMHEHVRSLRSTVRDEVARLHAALGAELRTLDAPAPRPQAPAPPTVPTPTATTPTATTPTASATAASATAAVGPTGGTDAGTGAVARVVALPEQRDRPPREQVTPTSGTPAVAAGE